MIIKYCICLWFFIPFGSINFVNTCDLLKTKYGFVCRCTADYCDYLSNPKIENNNTIAIISSNMKGLRFNVSNGYFINDETNQNFLKSLSILLNDSGSSMQLFYTNATKFFQKDFNKSSFNGIRINRFVEYQKVVGFGGALTGSVSHILQNLDIKLQNHIYRSYFHPEGIHYNILRLTIGGCDFDLTPWSYNEFPINDKALTNFTKLDRRDLIKIEQIQRIKYVANSDDIKIMAAAWSPPPWMKSNNDWTGYSYLKKEYYQTWADYHLRFLELMNAKNMTIWAISTGNEPLNGIIGWFFVRFMSLGWTPNDQAIYLDEYLGPTIRKNSLFKNVLIFSNDDQRYTYPVWFQKMNATRSTSLNYLDGLGVHWYWDNVFSPELIDITQEMLPDTLLLLNTEACVGDKPWETHGPLLGSWQRAEQYAKSLLQDFQHNFNGWIDWNLILNEYGGPNYAKNYVDSPIIVNTLNNKEFYKQPMFYVMGHFSKFISTDFVRIQCKVSMSNGNIYAVAFKSPHDTVTIIIFNSASMSQQIILEDSVRGIFQFDIPARSIHTLLYN